ncbi:glycosyl transferase group 1 [Gemmatirosa kalamazoonensis]|uniref:Glycosyl transferase group 1 n=1 Tax=Gemmatirosa kalamazoonensis TaxID=861299 RepID=W0RL29_9BACT|nr:glycosyltransferase [Gemmatirosa kalamazoonensis]AHG91035.1 glycosyl transferase group 1 [Gemmatirosa kalamazoonensis]
MSGGRIAFLIRSLGVGGAQRQLVELARGMHAAGRDVVVVTFYGGHALDAELERAGVRHVVVGKRDRWDVVGFGRRLLAVLRAERPAIVHGYLPDANLLLAVLRPLLRGARVVWGVRASSVDFSVYDRAARSLFAATRVAARAADLIICNSWVGAEFHAAQGYPAERMTVVPNGIDVCRFRPDPAAGVRARAEWGIDVDAPVIGLVGRWDAMKDHATFVRAAARLVSSCPATRFVFVGEGPAAYVDGVTALATELGVADRIKWSPPRRDVEAVYNALDLLTLCSRFGEGFPNVVGEAMACGTACVVTDVGDAARVVGDTGESVPIGDHAALADAWARSLRVARDADVRERCRERITANFDLASLLRNTEAALARLDAS